MLSAKDHGDFMEIDLDEVQINLADVYTEGYSAFVYLRQWRSDVTSALFELVTQKAPPLVVMAKVCVVAGLIKPEMIDIAFNTPGLAILIGAQDALVKKAKEDVV